MRHLGILTLGAFLALAAAAAAQTAGVEKKEPVVKEERAAAPRAQFVDEDGDGICDRYQANAGARRGRYGPGGGTGNQGVGPRDGTGYGAPTGAGRGRGVCDGTGPKGPGKRRGGRR